MTNTTPSSSRRQHAEVARVWLDLREKWQAISDREPSGPVGENARKQIAYIDEQLRRLDGKP